MERGANTGSRSMSGSCAHTSRDTAKNERIKFHGIFERKKQSEYSLKY